MTVHPRACGEHALQLKPDGTYNGSSPRMRGTRICLCISYPVIRFIPAHAGNTSSGRRWHLAPSVHPRACGEHYENLPWLLDQSGSSPRMRGTPVVHCARLFRRRFIPAHAGNTNDAQGISDPTAVHPRACGETHNHNNKSYELNRFIPAHAGNTTFRGTHCHAFSVHPRACGEHKLSSFACHR